MDIAVPVIPDHELLRRIGEGSYGEVWLARNVLGDYRAVKVVYRRTFESARPFDREFEGIKQFEPISRSHESQVQILHVGRADYALAAAGENTWNIVEVQVGEPHNSDVEILDGLKPTERVIGKGAILFKPVVVRSLQALLHSAEVTPRTPAEAAR